MDSNALNNLDPKLRATYDRVMGAANNSSPQSSTPSSTPVTPSEPVDSNPPMQKPIIPSGVPEQETTQQQTPAYVSDNLQFQSAIQSPFTESLASQAAAPQAASANISITLKILYVVGAIVFFLVYTFFWIKVFNLPLPF